MTEQKHVVTEEQLEREMKKITIALSEKAKRESLKQAFAGIEYARRDVKKRQHHTKRMQRLIGTMSVGVAAALMLFFALNGQLWHNVIPNESNEATGDPLPSEPSPSDTVDPSETPHVTEPSDRTTVDRPETKTIVTYPEGMAEERTYQLLYERTLPFTTYYPLDWDAQFLKAPNRTGVRLAPKDHAIGEMEIMFFDEGATDRDSEDVFNAWLDEMRGKEEIQRDTPYPKWATRSKVYVDDDRFYTFALGRRGDTYFYVRDHYILDAADCWGPLQQLIYDEWRWNDTNEPLENVEE